MRLNLFVAKSGYASRRKADTLIKGGNVSINGIIVKQPFFKVGSKDIVKVNGNVIVPQKYVYIIFNKPKGVTVTLKDKFAEKIITDFLPERFHSQDKVCNNTSRVYPAGRLDKDSQGLIILTNDGSLCYKITHPKFSIEKEYIMKLNRPLSERDSMRALKGINDEGEILKVKEIESKEGFYRVVISEGKKRHIRRLFKSLGFTVKALKRIRIGRLLLGRLREGKWRLIDKEKIYSLLA